jgi:hypothetical protein
VLAGGALWDDDGMSKRSTRVAKRDEFENAIKVIEEGLRSRRGKGKAAVTPEGESGVTRSSIDEGRNGADSGSVDRQE